MGCTDPALVAYVCCLLSAAVQSHQDHGLVARREAFPVRHAIRVHVLITPRWTVGRHRVLLNSDFLHVNHQHFFQEGIARHGQNAQHCPRGS